MKGASVNGSIVSRKKLLLILCMGLGMLSLGFVYMKWPQQKAAAVDPLEMQFAPGLRRHENIAALMQSGMQQEFSIISAAVPQRDTLDQRKLDSLANSASRLDNLARELGGYDRDLQATGKSREDMKYFRERVLQLDHVSQDLRDAALRGNRARVGESFKQISQACADCHQRFGVQITPAASVKKASK